MILNWALFFFFHFFFPPFLSPWRFPFLLSVQCMLTWGLHFSLIISLIQKQVWKGPGRSLCPFCYTAVPALPKPGRFLRGLSAPALPSLHTSSRGAPWSPQKRTGNAVSKSNHLQNTVWRCTSRRHFTRKDWVILGEAFYRVWPDFACLAMHYPLLAVKGNKSSTVCVSKNY